MSKERLTASLRAEYVKLENRLVLLAWLNDLFGYQSNQDLLADVKRADEGFDPYGQSYVRHRLVGQGEKLRVPMSDLGRYDDNIRSHLASINVRRPEPIRLRYFQYLALLYTEAAVNPQRTVTGSSIRRWGLVARA